MKIVIDRDKEINKLREMLNVLTDEKDIQSVNFAINLLENTGTPLPKGHGRLIDADELKMFGSWQMQIIPEGNGKYVETKIYTQRAVDAMPTIIPADKEESE